MNQSLMPQTVNHQVAVNDEVIRDFRGKMQNFITLLNGQPKQEEIDKTPDGKANSIPISFIEMNLDEIFLGQWSTENFKWSVIANEVVGSIDLIVVNPVSGILTKRTGAAAIQIQVDKTPDGLTGVERNKWALNPDNKKSSALDMGFPKLKAECTKNAAQSLGKLFGRDINRKKADTFKPIYSTVTLEEVTNLYELKKDALSKEERQHAERILSAKESTSYAKLLKLLQSK